MLDALIFSAEGDPLGIFSVTASAGTSCRALGHTVFISVLSMVCEAVTINGLQGPWHDSANGFRSDS